MTAIKYVYIAAAYTQGDPVLNTRDAIHAGDVLLKLGFVPFIPHLNHLWHTVSPKPYSTWLEYDNEWLTKCDAVLRLPGPSNGADGEVALAGELGIPVFHNYADLITARQQAMTGRA